MFNTQQKEIKREENFLDVAKSVYLRHTYKVKGTEQEIRCGIKTVKVRTDPHPEKNPEVDTRTNDRLFAFFDTTPHATKKEKSTLVDRPQKNSAALRWVKET